MMAREPMSADRKWKLAYLDRRRGPAVG